MVAWGVILDASTGRFGLSIMKDKRGTPWFSNKAFNTAVEATSPIPPKDGPKGPRRPFRPRNRMEAPTMTARVKEDGTINVTDGGGTAGAKKATGKAIRSNPVRSPTPSQSASAKISA